MISNKIDIDNFSMFVYLSSRNIFDDDSCQDFHMKIGPHSFNGYLQI